ncbi:MAG TPA: hydantoinase/oxoprolinase family protein [Solirubrobacteraceae bacterium]|nr:hydantoinase/oxoprolinase family protein [Solirubrobacteraceae bacterium]
MRTVDLDIGGTFTDCFLTDGDGRWAMGKAPTTRYDVSIGVTGAIADAAERLGVSIERAGAELESLRYTTTIGLNAILEGTGPKIGLITTHGFTDVLKIGRARSWVDGRRVTEVRNKAGVRKPPPLVGDRLIVGVRERVDGQGNVVLALDEHHVVRQVHKLVDEGARAFVVALLWSSMNPAHELRVGEIIESLFPARFLGAMPIVLAHEISPTLGEYPRTQSAIVNAYIERDLREELDDLGNKLRDVGFSRPVICVHNTGTSAKASRTAAINTYGSGPIAGLLGGAHLAQMYGLDNVVLTDMGGTSFDVGLLIRGKPEFYAYRPVIGRYFVSLPMLEIATIGAGGGSIARFDEISRHLRVGPQSAGAHPGPAAYGQGGREPTVTDADLVLGYLNPERFLGGRMRLDVERSRAAIERRLAGPLGVSVPEAAHMVRGIIDGTMGNEVFNELALKGFDPRDFTVFAYGGAGPTHAAGYAAALGSPTIHAFRLSPVFCAYGSSTAEISHLYQRAERLALIDGGSGEVVADLDHINALVQGLLEMAELDLADEGADPGSAVATLELQMRYGSQLNFTPVPAPSTTLRSVQDVRTLRAAFESAYARLWGPATAFPQGGIEVETFRLRVSVPKATIPFPETRANRRPAPSETIRAHRDVFWSPQQPTSTPIYEGDALQPGDVVSGPAIVESDNATLAVPADRVMTVDAFGSQVITTE